MSHTLQDRLMMLRRLLDATEQTLAAAESEENTANRKFQHQIVLSNLKQLADTATAAERDLADGLITTNLAFQKCIGLRQDGE
ncbi:hypothetical protein [Paraburkholderia sp. BCC1884]|uniref:hypothetical protein n=1 Tax=Paraburkholderia sp. BCC1884 TaxID=2562668 RepID=UPI0011840700|nr:hypothetical protein [Paraburkholderia sp. BCC1884]